MLLNTFTGRTSLHFITLTRRYSNNCTMDLKTVVKLLEDYAPRSLAEDWDNVGLLVEPFTPKPIKTILLTNDLTSAVMEEVVQTGTDLILSYHPPLFRSIKTIIKSNWKQRIVSECLERGIAIYSPHTSYDSVQGGVNDWLISAFGSEEAVPLKYSKDSCFTHEVVYSLGEEDDGNGLIQAIQNNLANECIIRKTEDNVVILCYEKTIPSLVAVRSSELRIRKLEKPPLLGHGAGRKMTLSNAITMQEAVNRVKKHLGLPHLRLALAVNATLESSVKSVCVCAGSGGSVLANERTDLALTGEMSHHEVLDFVHKGTSVILTDHTNCERGFLSQVLQAKLKEIFNSKINVIVSKCDADPLTIL